MNQNKNLFFYGIGANLIQLVGIVVIALSAIALLVNGILGTIGIVFGGGIILYGKSMRFDYQRQSGNIIHKGDW